MTHLTNVIQNSRAVSDGLHWFGLDNKHMLVAHLTLVITTLELFHHVI